jgi:CHAD domain-containing protein
MLESTKRYDLLRSRLRSFTRTLPRLKSIDTRGAVRAWVAVRRLRELLPLLQFKGASTGKLDAKLRRVVRRVELVRQSDARLTLFDDLLARERRGRLAAARVRDNLEQQAKRARTDLFRKKLGHDIRRTAAKLTGELETLQTTGDTRTQVRDLQWAVRARVARRASDLKVAIQAAGAVYLASRLVDVRTALRKLRFGTELASEVSPGVAGQDLRILVRSHTLLGELDDLQTLIDSIRQVQSTLATPDLKAWRDLDALVVSLENRCRGLHARYVRERTALMALCDRLVANAPAAASPKRKVG